METMLAKGVSAQAVGTFTQSATATFIADMSADLVRLARWQGFDALAFVLDLAKVEARSLAPRMTQGLYRLDTVGDRRASSSLPAIK